MRFGAEAVKCFVVARACVFYYGVLRALRGEDQTQRDAMNVIEAYITIASAFNLAI